MKDLNKILEAMDNDINEFIKRTFHSEKADIKIYLHQFIKEDPNVLLFSQTATDKAEFIPSLFIKKACEKYADLVKRYQATYFENKRIPIIYKLVNKIFDLFLENIAYYRDDLRETINPNENYPSLSDSFEKNLHALCLKTTKLKLMEDKEILMQAKFLPEKTSPYSFMLDLKRVEKLIDELTRSKLADLIQRKVETLSETKSISEKEKNNTEESFRIFKNQLANTKLFTTEIAPLSSWNKEGNTVLTAFLEQVWKKIEHTDPNIHKKAIVPSRSFFKPVDYVENKQNETVSSKPPNMSNSQSI